MERARATLNRERDEVERRVETAFRPFRNSFPSSCRREKTLHPLYSLSLPTWSCLRAKVMCSMTVP